MKKLLIATLVSTFALSAQAQWYVQGDLGYSKIADDSDLIDDSVFTQRISVGYDFGGYRIAADYTNLGKTKNDVSYYSNFEISTKVKSLGISAIYDFKNNSDFTPYLGARLAYNKVDISVSGASYRYYSNISVSESASRVGAGVLGGVQYKLTDNLKLNLGAEYNRLASDFAQVGVNAGLRYNF
ncbi:opacity family porin [Mannheimia sp. AT1]|uniref:Opacity family porin n=1 Tax=Mannheimia cairinae TaxID=3025936 RepID=A0ABT5MMU1_9PAST|nr:opacity family porin [Mannheimia cairinae]MDD0823495.1 opacity family porin [Mannheimia cairinae]MDD0826708.1 opacity family porin [Mannheimia cairinae]